MLAVALPHLDACTACTADRCIDPPTEDLPIEVEQSDGKPPVRVTGCPRRHIAEVMPLLRAVCFADKGILPVAGGLMDQTQAFVEGATLVWQCQAEWRDQKKRHG